MLLDFLESGKLEVRNMTLAASGWMQVEARYKSGIVDWVKVTL